MVLLVGAIPMTSVHVHASETEEHVHAEEETVAPVTEEIELVTEETEPVTEETEPVTEETAPVTEETEPVTEETEPVTEETEPVTEETEPVTEETEPVAEETEPVTEETEPVAKEIFEEMPVEGETNFADEDLPSSEELFAGYVEQQFYGEIKSANGIPAVYGTAAGARLTGNDKIIYDAMVPYIKQLANGTRTKATISVGQSVSYQGTNYIPDVQATFSGTTVNHRKIVMALLIDMPFECYWFDKTTGWAPFGLNNRNTGNCAYYEISFTVTKAYRGSSAYYTNATTTKAAANSAANAKNVVANYASYSDYDKLLAYKNWICNAVSYDHDAVNNGSYANNNNPWQLIYAFDGNPNTNIVCEGYSKAFMYLCDLSTFAGDVTCITATGVAGGPHMWNVVAFNGGKYMVDVTNSDAGCIGQNGGMFMTGASGSVSYGYTFLGVKYTYDEDDLNTWGSGSSSMLSLNSTSCKNHSFGGWTNGSGKLRTRNCVYCNLKDTAASSTCNHSYSSKVTSPTCTAQGYTTYTCTYCGNSYKDNYTDALGHNYVNYVCTRCGAESPQTPEPPVLPEEPEYDFTCTTDEKLELYIDSVKKCTFTVSDTTIAKVTKTTYESITGGYRSNVEITPLKPGTVTLTAKDSGGTIRATAVLYFTEGSHKLKYSHTQTAATCTTVGTDVYKCEYCSYTETRTVNALGHTGGTATCSAKAKCTRCGTSYGNLNPNKHSYQKTTVAPTTTEQGYDLYTCSGCGHSYKDNYTEPKKLTAPSVTVYVEAQTGKPYLQWKAVTGAKSYRVYRATSKSGTYKEIGQTTLTNFHDDGASVGKTYYYKVKSAADGRTSSYSAAKSGYCICAQPTGSITQTASSGKVKLKWGKVSGAKKYYVYRATSQNGSYEKITSTTKTYYTDSSAKVGKTYYYKIKAVASNTKYNSTLSYCTIYKGMRICAQVDLSLKIASNGAPYLSWDKVSGAAGYRIYRADSANGYYTLIDATESDSYKDKTAEFGRTYYYRVNVIGSKSGTDSVPATGMKILVACAKPSVSIKLSSKKPKVSWKSVPNAEEYAVYRATSKSGKYTKVAIVSGTSYTDKKAKKGKTYYYKVKAIGPTSATNSAYSSVVKIKVK